MRQGLCAIAVLVVTVVEAQAQCWIRSNNGNFGPNVNSMLVQVDAGTQHYPQTNQPGGGGTFHYGAYCSPSVIESRVWVDGRSGNGETQCWGHQDNPSAAQYAHNVCGAYSGGNWAYVEMRYYHPTFLQGCWGGTSQHFTWIGSSAWWVDRGTPGRCYSVEAANTDTCVFLYGGDYFWNNNTCEWYAGSPILLPMRGEALDWADYRLSGATTGVEFDIDGDGDKERIGWTAPGSNLAFLWVDRNGNGVPDNGTELFGNHTLPGAREGFAALVQMAQREGDDRVHAVDANDPLYDRLMLWEDRNHDGVGQSSELSKFGDVYASIGTGYFGVNYSDVFGNTALYEGWAERRTKPGRLDRAQSAQEHQGRLVKVYDVFFAMQ